MWNREKFKKMNNQKKLSSTSETATSMVAAREQQQQKIHSFDATYVGSLLQVVIELKGSLYSFEIETGQKWQCIFIGQFKMGLDKCNIGKD